MSSEESIQVRAGLPTASDYQIRIFEAFSRRMQEIEAAEKPQSICIKATAGSGKSTTILACTRLLSGAVHKPVFLAFGNRIAAELKGRLGGTGVEAMTTHSYWFRQWRNHIWSTRRMSVKVEQYRVHEFLYARLGLNNRRKSHSKSLYNLSHAAQVLTKHAKQQGVVPIDYTEAKSLIYDDTPQFWLDMVDRFEIEVEDFDRTVDLARDALRFCLDHETTVDFDDMLYLPAVKLHAKKTIRNEKHDVVVIDEVQDLNAIQRILCRRMMSDRGFILSVGDEKQSIFAFRGAADDSMERIIEDFDCEVLPLSISYRCARQIVEKAKTVYGDIEPAPDAPAGEVVELAKFTLSAFQPADLVVCRNNAPLISVAYKLIRARVPAKVIGKDIGKGLITIVKKLKTTNIPDFLIKLDEWKNRQLDIIDRKNPYDDYAKERIKDKHDSIKVFTEDPGITNTDQLIAAIEALFTTNDDDNIVVVDPRLVNLSTVHKAKGLEADRVFILDEHLFEPPWAKQPWEKIQERNVKFVGFTRAKTYMGFIRSDTLTD